MNDIKNMKFALGEVVKLKCSELQMVVQHVESIKDGYYIYQCRYVTHKGRVKTAIGILEDCLETYRY